MCYLWILSLVQPNATKVIINSKKQRKKIQYTALEVMIEFNVIECLHEEVSEQMKKLKNEIWTATIKI